MLTPSEEHRLDEIEHELVQDTTLRQLSWALASAERAGPHRHRVGIARWVAYCIAAVTAILIGALVNVLLGIAVGVVLITTTIVVLILGDRGGQDQRR